MLAMVKVKRGGGRWLSGRLSWWALFPRVEPWSGSRCSCRGPSATTFIPYHRGSMTTQFDNSSYFSSGSFLVDPQKLTLSHRSRLHHA